MSKTATLTSAPLNGSGYHTASGSSTRRPAAFMRLGSVNRQLEIPSFDEIYRDSPVADTASEREAHELEDFFADIEPNATVSSGWRPGAWLQEIALSVWKFWRREREITRDLAALSQMDDRMLRDIGVQHRVQLEHLIRFGSDEG